jgi:hypothetical protein
MAQPCYPHSRVAGQEEEKGRKNSGAWGFLNSRVEERAGEKARIIVLQEVVVVNK